jgi:ADP-ribosyl-[dinitrogen reductase] hydrolase
MVQDALRGANKSDLLLTHVTPLTKRHPEFIFREVRQSYNPSGYVVDTLQAVFQSFFDTLDFRHCLIDVVNRGGDADTTGAIAGMLAGALYELKSIPDTWRKALDTNISDACTSQAQKLIALAEKSSCVRN